MAAVATARHGAPSLIALGPRLALPAFPVTSLLAALPAWLVARLPDASDWHGALLLGPLLHAWAALALYRLAAREAPRGVALAAAAGWALASPALPASSAPGGALAPLALLGALSALRTLEDCYEARAALSGSLWLALLLFAQPGFFVAGLLLALLLARAALRQGATLREAWGIEGIQPQLFLALGPLAAALALGVGYRWQVTGTFGWPLGSASPSVPWPLPWLALGALLLVGGLLRTPPERAGEVARLVALAAALLVGAGWEGALAALPLGVLLALPVATLPGRWRWLPLAALLAMGALILPGRLLPPAPEGMGALPAARLQALQLAVGLGGAFAGLAVWWRRRGAMLLAAGAMVMVVGGWLWLGDLRAFQPVALQEVAALLPPAPPRGAELWYADPTLAEPLLALTGPRWRLVAMAPERLDEATLAARAAGLRQRNAPLYLLLPRRGGSDAIEGALAADFARARERGTPSYRLIEFWPFR